MHPACAAAIASEGVPDLPPRRLGDIARRFDPRCAKRSRSPPAFRVYQPPPPPPLAHFGSRKRRGPARAESDHAALGILSKMNVSAS